MDAQKDWPHESNMGPKSCEPRTVQAQVGAMPPIHIACMKFANFVNLKKVEPGNRKSSKNVPALCVSQNTPGSTNFRFSSTLTAKLKHQLIHNQWRISVFVDCMLGSQG